MFIVSRLCLCSALYVRTKRIELNISVIQITIFVSVRFNL